MRECRGFAGPGLEILWIPLVGPCLFDASPQPPLSYSDIDTIDRISPIIVELGTNRMPLEDNIIMVLLTPVINHTNMASFEIGTQYWRLSYYVIGFVFRYWIFVASISHSGAARSKAWTVFSRSNAGIVGSNPTQGMDVCLCVYSVSVLSCVQVVALWRADHSSKESYRPCENDYETEEEARAQQRAVEPLVNEWIPHSDGTFEIYLFHLSSFNDAVSIEAV
jgi:hypothetical protein